MGSEVCPECGSASKYTGWSDVIAWTCGSMFDSEFHQSVLCGEIEQLRTRETEKSARIAALSEELERVKTKWESGEEWYIYNRDRGDARIRGPYSSNIIASAVRDEMETYGQYGNENLVIMTEPKEPTQ